MKFPYIVCFLFLSLANSFAASQTNQDPKWVFHNSTQAPESAYIDDSGVIYVTNISGDPLGKDGVGWISRLNLDGKVLDPQWVSGLNAPKGIRGFGGYLWIADIDEMVKIEIASKKIERIKIPGTKFLNDVAIDEKGKVYVTDMLANKVFTVENNDVKVFLEGEKLLESPNGILALGDRLIIGGWGMGIKPDFSTKTAGHLFEINVKTKKKKLITKKGLGNLDGLEMDSDGNFLVSDWVAGKVYRVSPKGQTELLLEGFKGSADIGWHGPTNTLVVPIMNENRIVAYTIKKK